MNEVIENKKKSEILAEEFAKLEYGSMMPHSTISNIIQEDYPSQKYSTTIQKAKKILLKKYGKVIECIIGDGYRLVQPDDYVTQSLKHYKKGFNEIQKGTDTLSNAPVKDMTEEGRTIYRRVHDRAVILNAAMVGAKAELKTLSQRQHPMMLENIKN